MELLAIFDHSTCIFSILACILLTISYVASLYIWRTNLSRDHPSTIKRRFFSVSCMMLLAPFFMKYFLTKETLSKGELLEHLGLRTSGWIQATLLPLFLTAILFLGPLTMQFLSGIWKLYTKPLYWLASWQDLVWLRNHIMAPLSEEWVFRACMMPLLLQCLKAEVAIFTGPLLFGTAHFHHMFEQMKSGYDFKTALMVSSFQFTYTSLFGAYSAYLFLRTGHFVAPLVAHIFCNHMGFPNFGEIPQFQPLQRILIICNFIIGFILWCLLLTPLTTPGIYDNRLYWET
ncbi:CAAX prenyl protease 2 isoform X2 [Bombyx mandarina]|uniref:CAAX prenyl protease 2 n=2 Tax=Bombyx TaxID=7090 RepID=A0A8R2AS71_BOMMO|nr:CAAX prenyl protease 2 [Bombyx mori]XP_028031366.1 CAAX prenyl protease 2 isoform X2 [Bombyx mandarina]